MDMDELHWQQAVAARAELRRIVGDELPPSATPLEDFGPWAEYLGPLRRAYADRGPKAAQQMFLTMVRRHRSLADLVDRVPERHKSGWTMAELMGASFPHAGWIVPGILPLGISTLAGRPKMGKSWLALQIAVAVGTGGRVLDRDVEHGPVLYIALEDGLRRLQDRLHRLGAAEADVFFCLEWQPLDEGGLKALKSAIDRHSYRLVVVDTLNRSLARVDPRDLVGMSLLIGGLQDLARGSGAAILTIDHHRKPLGGPANPVDDILGSTGKAALVDAALGIYREPGRQDATLHVTGRDLEPVELAIGWDPECGGWVVLGEAPEVEKESVRGAVLAAIRELSELGEVTSTTNIARHLGKAKGNVGVELAGLIAAGKVVKGRREGRLVPYFLADEAPPPA